jgi:hypothetical protein
VVQITAYRKIKDFMAVVWVKARLPVRSALFKQDTGGLVVRWVTTSESPLLYVFISLFVNIGGEIEKCNVVLSVNCTLHVVFSYKSYANEVLRKERVL